VLSGGGLLFLFASVVAIGAFVWSLTVRSKASTPPPRGASTEELGVWFIEALLGPMLLLFAAVFSALVGYVLLRTAGAASREVIPRQDYELPSRLLLENNDRGVDQYIRLSGLGGFAGIFAKAGLSGLPLATHPRGLHRILRPAQRQRTNRLGRAGPQPAPARGPGRERV